MQALVIVAALAVTQPTQPGNVQVVGIGCAPPAGEWSTAVIKSATGYKAPSIAVGRDGLWLATLPASATAADVRRVLQRPAGVAAAPFRDAKPTADDDKQLSRSRWTWSEADIPDYMARYEPAKMTQAIYKIAPARRSLALPRIDSVPRSQLEEKWNVPGGLVGVGGWRSSLYRYVSGAAWWVGRIDVLNGTGFFQPERGWKVRYEPDTEFLDVLTNTDTGGVFEVRRAVKTPEGWQRFVSYRAPEHRPAGYAGPHGLDCRGCHEQAGTGSYGTGLVPGGDTVLSMGFEELER